MEITDHRVGPRGTFATLSFPVAWEPNVIDSDQLISGCMDPRERNLERIMSTSSRRSTMINTTRYLNIAMVAAALLSVAAVPDAVSGEAKALTEYAVAPVTHYRTAKI